jgi:hypothetical protein
MWARTAPVRSPQRHQLSGYDDRLECRDDPGHWGGQIDDHTHPSRIKYQPVEAEWIGEKGGRREDHHRLRASADARPASGGPVSATTQHPGRETAACGVLGWATAVTVRLGIPHPARARLTSRSPLELAHRPRWHVCDGLLFYFKGRHFAVVERCLTACWNSANEPRLNTSDGLNLHDPLDDGNVTVRVL